ncbi:hypothetical protein BC834DRAFT_891895 [Gloeopeniophorella convolvens]|nr:hypothetical protein BC834DRAFT_891895 [Gloeopeniophorella convolvens]
MHRLRNTSLFGHAESFVHPRRSIPHSTIYHQAAMQLPPAEKFASGFAFGPLSNLSTCGTATISWNYTGPNLLFNLSVVHDTFLQFLTIAAGLNTTERNWTWDAVTVPSGQYVFAAEAWVQPNTGVYFVPSRVFAVQNGTNTGACPTPSSLSSVLTSLSSSPTSSRLLSSSSPSLSTLSAPPSSQSPSGRHAPPHGVVLGAASGSALLAVVVAALAIGVYCRKRVSRSARGTANPYTRSLG